MQTESLKEPALKKKVQSYWAANVPGLDAVPGNYTQEDKEFYTYTDALRYKHDSYIPPLIDSFVKPGERILEVGCGMGSDSRHIASRGGRIVSLDFSWSNVNFALKGMRLLGLSGRGTAADAEKLPFADNTFDVVYSFGVLHHTPDTQKAIDEVRRVLKPGGKCVIMLYHKGYAYYVLLLQHGYKKLFGKYTSDNLMSHYDHTPLSRLYSRSEIKRIFSSYRNLKMSVTAFGGTQVHPVLKYVYWLLMKSNFLMQRFGSFLIIKAEK